MTTMILVVVCIALVVLDAWTWLRLRQVRGVRDIRAGVADYFTDALCAGITRKLGPRKANRIIDAAMFQARNEHRRQVTKVQA